MSEHHQFSPHGAFAQLDIQDAFGCLARHEISTLLRELAPQEVAEWGQWPADHLLTEPEVQIPPATGHPDMMRRPLMQKFQALHPHVHCACYMDDIILFGEGVSSGRSVANLT